MTNLVAMMTAVLLGVLPSTTSRIDYTAIGGTTFTFGFKVTDTSHIKVFVDSVPQSTGFAVALTPKDPGGTMHPGGTVTFTVAPTTGKVVRIERTVPLSQDSIWTPYGAFKAKTMEGVLDKLVTHDQQLERKTEDLDAKDASLGAKDTALQAEIDVEEVARAAGDTALSSAKADRSYVDGAVAALAGMGTPGNSVLDSGTALGRTMSARFNEVVNVRDAPYNAKGDGVTDDRAAFTAAYEAVPAGGTIIVPCANAGQFYKLSGGHIVNKPVRVLGYGTCSRIKLTGGTGYWGFLYFGGSVPNATPFALFAPGTQTQFDGNLTAGQVVLAGLDSTTGFAAGDDVYLSLGNDPYDYGQQAFRMFNRIKTVDSATQVTLETPLPEAVSGDFSRANDPTLHVPPGNPAHSAWTPKRHYLHKFTTPQEGYEVGNLSIEHTSAPAGVQDPIIFANRSRHIRIHDLFIPRTGIDQGVVGIGECEDAVVERIYTQRGGGVGAYGSRNVTFRNIVLRQLTSTGIMLESQNRGVVSENFIIEASAEHGTQQILFPGGNSQGVVFRNFTFNHKYNGAGSPWLHLSGIAEGGSRRIVTENFAFYGDPEGVFEFPLRQHRGTLILNGNTYRETKTFRKKITVLANQGSGVMVPLVNGIIKQAKFRVTPSRTGITVIRFADEGAVNQINLWDGTSDRLPPDGTYGFVYDKSSHDTAAYLRSGGVFTGASWDWNYAPGMKYLRYYSNASVAGGTEIVVEVEAFVLDDDGVAGSLGDVN
jgi:hypothetical protein